MEGFENGAKFILTKQLLFGINEPKVIMLSVSGLAVGKKKLIKDFVEAFGDPVKTSEYPELPGITYLSWWDKEDIN